MDEDQYTTPYYANRVRARHAGSARPQTTPRASNQSTDRFLSDFDVAGFVGGLTSLGMGAYDMTQQGLGLPQISGDIQYSPGGQPVYNLGDEYNAVIGAKPQGPLAGEIFSGVGSGAAAGTAIAPGIGTAIGAAVGGLTSALGGGIRASKQRREKRKAKAQLQAGQRNYNTAMEGYEKRRLGTEDYYDRLNNNDLLQNLY
jgi:hypothetical protein